MTQKSPITLLLIPAAPLLFLILSTSFDLIPSIGVFNGKRLLESITLAAVFGLTLAIPRARHELAIQAGLIPRWVGVCLLVLFTLGMASALRFPHPGYGIADVTTLALMVLAMLIVAAIRRHTGEQFDRLVLGGIAAIGIIVAVQELMGLVAGWVMGVEFSYSTMLVRFAHPRFYNQLQSWSMLLLAALPLVFLKYRNMRFWAVCLLGLQWCLLVMSGGRGSMISLVTALLIIGLVVKKSRRSWLGIQVAGILLGAVLYALIFAGHDRLAPEGGSFVEQSVGRQIFHTTGRSHLWQLAVVDATAHPLLGAGPMRFNCAGDARFPAHPHSFPLRILSEWGIPAFMLLVLVCAWLGWRMLRNLAEEDGRAHPSIVLRSMLAASVVAAGLHACLSGLLTMPASQVMAFLICGWLLGAQGTGLAEKPVRNPLAWSLCILALLGSIGILGFNVHEIRNMDYRVSNLVDETVANPRYWQYGRACRYVYSQ